MKNLSVFLYEWKHFSRNRFKVVALLLYVAAGIYGLHNGAALYQQQVSEIERIEEEAHTGRQKYIAYYDEGKKGPEDRPWVDMTTPFWAIWYASIYHFKMPSPAIVYSIGQAEQYGFYKRVTFLSSPYDADMAEEIANPERLQTGTLDFAFVVLFLLPLLLLILLYNVKSAESEQGFLPLIEVQTVSTNSWLLSRVSFYATLVLLSHLILIFYGAMLTPVLETASQVVGQVFLYIFLSLVFWSTIYFLILRKGKTITGNALKMVGICVVFLFIIPAVVHQWLSIKQPANLMTDFIDANRDKKDDLYNQPDSVIQAQLFAMFPEIVDSPLAQDTLRIDQARNRSTYSLVNELMKASIVPIENENDHKNQFIRTTYWFNPVTFFQNQFNKITQTHYRDYQQYRDDIQNMIDGQIRMMVLDIWQDVKVDKAKYLEYANVTKVD